MNPYTHFEECDEKFIQLIKDLDSEGIKDTIFIRKEESRIISMPSSHKFEEIKSREIEILNENSGITETKNEFEFYNNWMRAGYRNQFRYDPKLRKCNL